MPVKVPHAMGPDAFDYELPAEQIAQRPPADRDGARMLVLGSSGPPIHSHVRALPDHLPPRALVVVNASRVVPARLWGARSDGRVFELLLCAPAAGQGPSTTIAAWVRGAKRLRPEDTLQVGELVLRYQGPDAVDPRARAFVVVAGDVLATCQAHGAVPLPPYIERPDGRPDDDDAGRYQTVFAGAQGSVAAPTAGLHFDDRLLAAIDPVKITLHVGPGTFLPMDVDDVRDHRVGAERYTIEPDAAERIAAAREEGRPIVAVGTTVTRALEAAAAGGHPVAAGSFATDLVIRPGHRFFVVTHLLTNFHLPKSSLLMLVCSLGGNRRVLDAYREAVAAGYRFYSYGDCMLVHGAQSQ